MIRWPRRQAEADALVARLAPGLVAREPTGAPRGGLVRRAQTEPDGQPAGRALLGVAGHPRPRGDRARLPAAKGRGVRQGARLRAARRYMPGWSPTGREADPRNRRGHRLGDTDGTPPERGPRAEQPSSRG